MNLRRKERPSGTYPRVRADVKTDDGVSRLSLDEILSVIGKELSRYDSRKTFAVVAPKSMSRDEALDSLRAGRYEIRDMGREIELHIFERPEKPVA